MPEWPWNTIINRDSIYLRRSIACQENLNFQSVPNRFSPKANSQKALKLIWVGSARPKTKNHFGPAKMPQRGLGPLSDRISNSQRIEFPAAKPLDAQRRTFHWHMCNLPRSRQWAQDPNLIQGHSTGRSYLSGYAQSVSRRWFWSEGRFVGCVKYSCCWRPSIFERAELPQPKALQTRYDERSIHAARTNPGACTDDGSFLQGSPIWV